MLCTTGGQHIVRVEGAELLTPGCSLRRPAERLVSCQRSYGLPLCNAGRAHAGGTQMFGEGRVARGRGL